MKARSYKLRELKVAIVHDVLLEYGGSERVVEELLGIFPNADFYTLYFNKSNGAIFEAFNKVKPKTSFFQNIPFLHKLGKYFSIMKIFSWLYFYQLDLSSYELVISSSHSYNSKIVRTPKGSIHICYLHTPPKYLYKEESELAWVKKFPFNGFFYPLFVILRFIDKKAGKHPDIIVVNSEEVKRRVEKYYERKSFVIYPPVSIPKRLERKGHGYYLVVSRLVRQKGLELAVKTCTKHNLTLVVVGEGHMRPLLEKIAGPTVSFLGWVPDEDLSKVYRAAKALIYCAIDEDFGIVPVQAMGYGVPVIAYKSGGVKETVINRKTGIFFKQYSQKSLYEAIKNFEVAKFNPTIIGQQAEKFSDRRFKEAFKRIVKSYLRQ